MCHPPCIIKHNNKRWRNEATCSLAAKCWPTFAKMTDILTRPTFSSLDSCIIISSSSITYISHCQIEATKGPNIEQQKILEFHFGIFVESSGHSVNVIMRRSLWFSVPNYCPKKITIFYFQLSFQKILIRNCVQNILTCKHIYPQNS